MKVNGKDLEVNIKEVINEDFFKKQSLSKLVDVKEDSIMRAFVKFKDDDDKIIVNPWRKKGRDISTIYYIQIENRGYEWLPFTEWTVSSLSIPLKYRFKDESKDISEEFTTAFNLNFFLGWSYGETRFKHRKAVGNKSNTWKISGGLILGASTVTLNNTNTSSAVNPIASGDAVNQGLFSLGLGATYSFNKINFGLFYGWDNSIGDSAKKWNYNGKPWLGVGVGYSLFKI